MRKVEWRDRFVMTDNYTAHYSTTNFTSLFLVILPIMLRNLIQAYVSLLQKSRKLKWNKTTYAKSFFNIFQDRNKYCRNQQIRLTSHSPIHVKPPWSPNTHEATLIFHFTWSHPDLPFQINNHTICIRAINCFSSFKIPRTVCTNSWALWPYIS